MRGRLIALALVANIVNAVDAALTHILTSMGFQEANPLYHLLGDDLFYAVKLGSVALYTAALAVLSGRWRSVEVGCTASLLAMVAVFSAAIANSAIALAATGLITMS